MISYLCNFLLRIRVKATASSPKSKRFKTYNSSSFFFLSQFICNSNDSRIKIENIYKLFTK